MHSCSEDVLEERFAGGTRSVAAGTVNQRRIAGRWRLGALLGLQLSCFSCGGSPETLQPEARSLLLVTLDTTRADHLQPYGAENVETPVLARLAEEGVLFEKAYATTPVTLPSHASILTGLDPLAHGVRQNGAHYLREGATTLSELLNREGFRTAAFVSAAVLERRYGLDQGFELYDDDLSGGNPMALNLVAERPAEVTVASAREWLDGLPEGDRFFLWVHFFDPHVPYSPPAPYSDRFPGRPYDGEIAYMDAQLGVLLSHPRLTGSQVVLVSVIGDHGEGLGEHGEQTHSLLAYDSTLRVPWILRIPSGPAGRRIGEPVSQVDLFPTALDLLGFGEVSEEFSLDGVSRAPFILNGGRFGDEGSAPTSTPIDQRALYAETLVPFYTYGWSQLRAVRVGEWKLIDAPEPELYNVEDDPQELDNLFAVEARQSELLYRALEQLVSEESATEPILPVDRETEEKLRSLGYVSGRAPGDPRKERPDPKKMIDLHDSVERARGLLYAGEPQQATEELQGVLVRDPDNLAALSDLAKSLGELGRFDEAKVAASKALALDPENPPFHILLATLEAELGEMESAIVGLDAALALDPRSVEAKLEKGRYLARLGRGQEASQLLETALRDEPQDPRLNIAVAELVEAPAGRLDAAERRLKQVVAQNPFLPEGWGLLGWVLERAQRSQEALEIYQKGLQYQPRNGTLHAHLGMLLVQQPGNPQAEVHLREALRLLRPASPALYSALGDWLMGVGRLEEAQEQYSQALTLDPGDLHARHGRAESLFRLGRDEPAERIWQALIEENPEDALAHESLAAISLKRGRWALAETQARRAVELAPQMPTAWTRLALALGELGRLEEALSCYARAETAEPRFWPARFNHALLLRKMGRFKAARSNFEEVLSQIPAHGGAHCELAWLYGGPLKTPVLARRHYAACLDIEPNYPLTGELRQLLATP